jgi:hypothetical protein
MFGIGGAETNIKAIITAEDKASSVLKGFGDNVGSLGGLVEKGLKTAAIGIAAAGAAAAGFGVLAVKAFSESQDVLAQTNAVLRSTGSVAGVSADQVAKLAHSFQQTTKFSDETVQSGENLLLTFTSIGKDIFPLATQTMLDMSQALGQDTKNSAIQLGKALQDPILGITALRRVGVNFTDSQQEMITKLVESGHKLDAQKLILKELQTEFGGSAEAAGNTFSGKLAILKNNLNDVEEAVGSVIVDALTPFVDKIAWFTDKIDWQAFGQRMSSAFALFGRVLSDIITTLRDPDVTSTGAWGTLERVVSGVRNVFDGMIIVLESMRKAWDFLYPSIRSVWEAIAKDLLPSLMRLWQEVIIPLAPVIGVILVGALFVLINALKVVIVVISEVINIGISFFNFFTKTLPDGIAVAVDAIINWVIYLKNNFWSIIGEIIGFVATLPIKLPVLMVEAIYGMIRVVASVNWAGVFSGIWQGMQWVWDRITDTVNNAWHWIHNLKWGDLFAGIGKSLANGLLDLIEGALKGAVKGLPGNVENKIHLPRFAQGVKNFGGGWAVVGEQGEEIVNLPKGSDVIPNNQIRSGGMGGGGQVNVVVNVGLYAGSEQEKRQIGLELLKAVQDAASAKSSSVAQMLGI